MAEETQDQNVFSVMVSPIMDILQQGQESYDIDAATYNLSFHKFLLNMLFGIFNGFSSIRMIITQITTTEVARKLGLITASKTAYSEAFHRYSPEQFKLLFIALLKTVPFIAIPELHSLGQFYLVDGSVFPAISSMVWAQYKSNSNAIKLHLSFNLNRMIPVQFLCTDGKWSERKFLASIIERGITYICDRGYVSFNTFHDIVENGASFIMRGKGNMVFSTVATLPVVIQGNLINLMTAVSDIKVVFSNDPHKHEYRIVSFIAGSESYLLITDRLDLLTYQVIMLYAYRWQVELMFRLLKRTMKGLHLMAHHPQGIEVQFYLYLIAYLLLLTFKQKCAVAKTSSQTFLKHIDTCEAIESNENSRAAIRSGGRHYVCGLVTMLGEKLKEYWKFGIHWLATMRNSLLMPIQLAMQFLA